MRTYKIEIFCEKRKKFVTLTSFFGMRKSFADGAWTMLKSLYGSEKKYRLVEYARMTEGEEVIVEIIDEWGSPKVYVN